MNWALHMRHGGGGLSLSPPTSFRKPGSHHIYRGLGKGSRKGKGWCSAPAPREPGAELVGAERGTGKETGWAAMPARTEGLRAS